MSVTSANILCPAAAYRRWTAPKHRGLYWNITGHTLQLTHTQQKSPIPEPQKEPPAAAGSPTVLFLLPPQNPAGRLTSPARWRCWGFLWRRRSTGARRQLWRQWCATTGQPWPWEAVFRTDLSFTSGVFNKAPFMCVCVCVCVCVNVCWSLVHAWNIKEQPFPSEHPGLW